jgi:hypothetical protein
LFDGLPHGLRRWRAAAMGATAAVLLLVSAAPTLGAPDQQTTPQSPQATPQSPQATPVPPGTLPPPPSRFFGVDPIFRAYYDTYDGGRLLGQAISPPRSLSGRTVQYFEKGRMEDFRGDFTDPNWQFMYGLLVDELKAVRATVPVGGDVSTVNYGTIADRSADGQRVPVPSGFVAGQPLPLADGSVFIPFTANLAPAPGHTVPPQFWQYISKPDLFPGGWLHDVGLPITEPISAVVTKGPQTGRTIMVQAFQRTILTYDALNPPEWQVERANVGSDYARIFPERVL